MQRFRDMEEQAQEVLPAATYDYFAGGAGDERSLAEAVEAWKRIWLRPRQLAGVGGIARTAVADLLGGPAAAPVAVAPMAALRLLHPDGEEGVARAAAAAGLPYTLSTRATADLAEVAAAAPEGRRWFQLYFAPDRARVAAQLQRAAAHGYERVVMTVDLPVAGRRERELGHGPVPFPPGVALASHLGHPLEDAEKPAVGGWAALTWEDVGWVAETSGLPVTVKGVLTAEDAQLAVVHGAEAIVVSAHGARQLDGAVPTAVALPEVVDAVGGRVPVLVDGGIRDGADVVRALALGASAVLVGRPVAWGLATGGREGVRAVLGALVDDLAVTLALVGAAGPGDVRRDHVRLGGGR